MREYEQEGEYHLRSNLLVLTSLGQWATVGFECQVFTERSQTVGIIEIDPFEPETIPAVAPDLESQRMQYGGSACPDIDSWKVFSEEIENGNYAYELDDSCVWLEKGTLVFGPIDREEYKLRTHTTKFVKVRLANGKQVWIEPGNL